MAVRDFQRARKEAALQQVLARLRGKSANLLCYDDVRRHLRAGDAIERGLQEIPLDKIVGSVGRYQDFTRSFLPKNDSDEERWARVKAAVTDMKGMSPIEVYQVGDAYFVIDGNHRVSVARQLNTPTITAYVTEVQTRVPLKAGDDPEELICKSRYAEFLESTNLDKLRPGADLLMTFCGQYRILLDQIEAEHRLLKEYETGRLLLPDASYEQAVGEWYDGVYMPVVHIIRELGVMRRFPERTEADIYVLLSERREELEEALGWTIDTKTAVSQLLEQQSRPLLLRLAPDLETGPEPGHWRETQLALHREQNLFTKMLVLLEGIEGDWQVLEQVIRLAQLDEDHILGLHVVKTKSEAKSTAVAQLKAEFERRCQEAGVGAEFAVDVSSSITAAIIKRAAWVDLVVINLTNPPEMQPLARLGPGWGRIIQQCPRPLLVFPDAVESSLDRALLAYDGSAKANEALFIATYLAVRWHIHLTILTVKTQYTDAYASKQARDYLERHGVDWADYVVCDGPINEAILATAESHDINLLIMGGFGLRPVMRVVLGSTVEYMLREFTQPMLICR
jgi:nucleotide-binding universal stress UspA family protein